MCRSQLAISKKTDFTLRPGYICAQRSGIAYFKTYKNGPGNVNHSITTPFFQTNIDMVEYLIPALKGHVDEL